MMEKEQIKQRTILSETKKTGSKGNQSPKPTAPKPSIKPIPTTPRPKKG